MYTENELLPLSGVQHLIFCERQAALIHVEGLWADNALTVEGGHRHKRVHEGSPRRERRGEVIISRGLVLRSLRLGLAGIADVVEFHRIVSKACDPEGKPVETPRNGIRISGAEGLWVPFPVEYKRGRPKPHRADEVQLCAQGLCLEEMLGVVLSEGALFYGKEQRRVRVTFDEELRDLTADAARRFHELVTSGRTPRAVKEPKCRHCSLGSVCLPEAATRRPSARRYIEGTIQELLTRGDDG